MATHIRFCLYALVIVYSTPVALVRVYYTHTCLVQVQVQEYICQEVDEDMPY
jgi:hypothetical protein